MIYMKTVTTFAVSQLSLGCAHGYLPLYEKLDKMWLIYALFSEISIETSLSGFDITRHVMADSAPQA